MHKRLVWILLAVSAAPLCAQRDTTASVRGVVVDSANRPVAGVEVYAVTAGRTGRTGDDGRFAIAHLVAGPTRLIVRRPGWRPVDSTVVVSTERPLETRFVLRRLPQALDTVRVVSHDDCPARTLEGFECRRRAGIGVFRDKAEILAAKPVYWADMLDGVPGLRRLFIPPSSTYPPGPDYRFESTTGWRCLKELYDGDISSLTYRPGFETMGPADIVGVEFYDAYSKVPEWYKRYAFDPPQRGTGARAVRGGGYTPGRAALPSRHCALVVYWTRFATRFDPRLDQSPNVQRTRRPPPDSAASKKPGWAPVQ